MNQLLSSLTRLLLLLLTFLQGQSFATTKEVVVFGATGATGGATVDALLASPPFCSGALRVSALVRDASSDKAKALRDRGVAIQEGNYDDKASLKSALKTAHCCFLSCRNALDQVELETNVIDAAEESETCQYLVKISTCQAHAPDQPPYISPSSTIQYGQFHAAIETRLQACQKLQYTSLRPNYFLQNFGGDIFGTLPNNKNVVYPHQNNHKATVIDVRDIGAVAAKLLLLDKRKPFANKCLNLCGPKSWSIQEIAEAYSQALGGQPIEFVRCSSEDFVKALEAAGFPDWLAKSVAKTHSVFWDNGGLEYESSPEILELIPKANMRGMEDWIQEMAPMVQFAKD